MTTVGMMSDRGVTRYRGVLLEQAEGQASDPLAHGDTDMKLPAVGERFAIDCKSDVADAVGSFVKAGIAPATRRAYRSDIDHFVAWGGTIPATDAQLAAYVAAHAATLKVATLVRRLAAISVAHEALKAPNPVGSPLVRATLRGIRRVHGVAQRQARPLLREELFATLAAMRDRPKDVRDRALLLLGFAGGFRRSELCALNHEDFHPVRQGLIVSIRRSKTDQEGTGRKVGIPLGRTAHCPVTAVERWIATTTPGSRPLFRPIDRHGRISAARLSGDAVSLIVRERVAAAGFEPSGYSGHSLRAGFATSAAAAGVQSWKIRQQTGHASDAMLMRYIRDGDLFVGNAAGSLL